MKIIFLDIDGVLNHEKTPTRYSKEKHLLMMDQERVFWLNKFVDAHDDIEVVLSSSWRNGPRWREEMRANGLLFTFLDKTPPPWYDRENDHHSTRGEEIQKWLDEHTTVQCTSPTSCPKPTRRMCSGHTIEKYAIIDDDSDMLPEQMENFFQSSWKTGMTEELFERVKNHLL